MLEKIAKIIRDYKGDQDIVVTAQSTFEELELDSLDTVELVMSIEEEFSITIEVNDDIKSVADLMKIVENVQAGV